MDVVFNQNGISDCAVPCVAQSFINHGAVLYKLFVLGPVWFVVVRPSLKNFYAGGIASYYCFFVYIVYLDIYVYCNSAAL
ncbi:inositol-tetrakisphosphate 1-kinase-like [Macrobrachium nipponense]|uniref:inositol-tetrakisphosphate 1-kinase-like n=1 Tax=Macrobrachium nipponense TaxID=159736 RepID=UPI0030C85D6A